MGQVTTWFTDLGIVALISIGGTYLAIAKYMQKRYQTLIASEVQRVANEKLHIIVDAKLDVLKRKILFLTLLCDRVCKEVNVPECDIQSFRRSCEVNNPE